jgi:acetyltransferase-like isoleucine patch superfamily enzyme
MKLRIVLARLISVLPLNVLRVFAYRAILGYEIHGSKIGFGTVIDAAQVKITKSHLGVFNLFTGPMSILLKENTYVGAFNRFHCGYWAIENEFDRDNYERRLEVAENTIITSHHLFDVAGSIVIGRNTWIAGVGSQFWTHGIGIRDRNIEIGMNCYVGSAVRFAPGARIGNNVLVGLGSVVTKRFAINNALIGGCPAVVIKVRYDWTKAGPTATLRVNL